MRVPTRYVLHQGPMLGTIAHIFWLSIRGTARSNRVPVTIPGPEFTATIPPRPPELVRDYIRYLGGDPSAYRGILPGHLFPQYTFPIQAQGLRQFKYPLHRMVVGGFRLEMNNQLPVDKPLQLNVRVEDVDDNGRRAVIHQRVAISTDEYPDAAIAHVYAVVRFKSKGKGLDRQGGKPSKPRERACVPEGARELARWKLVGKDGLNFAKLTGDFNPIHWIAPAARAVGFPHLISHGFGTAGRAIEGLNRSVFSGNISKLASFDTKLIRPLVVPANVGLYLEGDNVFVGDAPGGLAYMTAVFSARN